jgi:hypothetical protein
MAVNQRCLHRVQTVPGNTFDGDELLAIKRGQKLNARVDSTCRQPVTRLVDVGDNNGAGTAIALGASFLGARPAKIIAKELQHGPGGADISQFDNFTVENEANRIAASGC